MVRRQCPVHDGFAQRFQSRQILHETADHTRFSSQARDVRIIIANFNQTVATQMFCHVSDWRTDAARLSLLFPWQAAHENVYGSRYQWIILGYPTLSAWWHERTACSMQELVRAINGTLQTRVPRLSMDKDQVSESWS